MYIINWLNCQRQCRGPPSPSEFAVGWASDFVAAYTYSHSVSNFLFSYRVRASSNVSVFRNAFVVSSVSVVYLVSTFFVSLICVSRRICPRGCFSSYACQS